jgi:hypothetical protein
MTCCRCDGARYLRARCSSGCGCCQLHLSRCARCGGTGVEPEPINPLYDAARVAAALQLAGGDQITAAITALEMWNP